ncbi:MAG: LPS export ABC transporter periplasmic protein LptC [Bacteroidota bacterium]
MACENDAGEVTSFNRKTVEVEEGRDIVGSFSQAAVQKAKLVAPLMYRVKADSPYTEFPKSIHVDFYKPDHSIESVVKARYGKYFDNLGKVYLKDSVIVYNTTGDTLYCDDLWWDQNANVFYTDKKVVIHTKTQQLNGSGLWALANFSRYIIKNTTGIVDIPESVQP